MRVLLPENRSFNMEVAPDAVEDLRYCVLDYSHQDDVDFVFIPLIFLDRYPRPAADLQIGRYRIQVPLDWSIVIADKNFGQMEILKLEDLRDRPFDAFIMNPITAFMPEFGEITHLNVWPDVNWTMPKLALGHILAVPLTEAANPPCAFFVRDVNRLPDSLDITKVFT